MGMDGRSGASYRPTVADIRYHELCCGGVLAPGASREEVMADMELLREAIEKDKKAKSILPPGYAADRRGGRVANAVGLADGRMQQQQNPWRSNMRGPN